MRIGLAAILVVSFGVLGCGSDDSGGGSGGTSGSGGGGGSGATGGSGGSAGGLGSGGSAGGNGTLSAPVIDMVMPMAPAGLHVSWTNAQSDCDEVEGERKSASEPYAVVFTVPGEADNEHDASATQLIEYTYRLRCHKGSDYSPYSNEMSGTPE
jgi:hypothetical protein